MASTTNRFGDKRVDISDHADIEQWAGKLGLSVVSLRAIVIEVGTWIPAIQRKLKES